MGTRGFMAKAGALTAGTALAGAALFGGVAVAPTVANGITASVQHDYALTAFPTFTESLQTLLDTLGFGNMGQVLGLFGDGISTTSTLADLLAALNPDDVSLNAITGGFLGTDLTAVLNDVQIGGVGLGDVPIDSLIGGFIGGAGADTSIGDLLGFFGLGPYAGLLDLPMLGLSPTDTLASLLNEMLGIGATTSINDLLDANGMTDATIASLLGITPDQLGAGWDQFVDGITLGGTLSDPEGTGHLGEETLSALLTSLLGTDATAVTDSTTLTDFLGDLGIFSMFGLG
ncbi:hypothetical protein A5648_11870 [Mycolicibacter sinensis]|uniref:PE-PGRS family protein n=2 Tax=Mycolicibacter sinensis (strain JDM601) TaxID=875328 RepID=A0A1A3TLZ3_MYCSD|nr:hypothetical protein A5648_11870 [Mycolicibacter sinensis]